MRLIICLGALALSAGLGACSSDYQYASACERDYADNRAAATAAGALLGGAAGAAVADNDRRSGAAIGAVAGGLIGNQLAREDDPCGYGFGGYARDRYDRYDRGRDYDQRRRGYYDDRGRWHRR